MNVLENILEEQELTAIKNLIEENEKCFNSCEGRCSSMENGICNCEDGAIVQAIYKIKKYLDLSKDTNALSNDGWIPVEERLPEDNSKILCTTEYGEVVLCRYSWNNPHTKKKFFGVGGGAAYSGIIAWQPLPTRYIPPVISKRAQDLRDLEEFFTE